MLKYVKALRLRGDRVVAFVAAAMVRHARSRREAEVVG